MTRTKCITTAKQVKKEIKGADICFVILAANPGYRMKSFGSKTMLKLNDGTNILEKYNQVILNAYPNSEIILVTGFEADKVIKNSPPTIRIVENQLYETTNEIEQLRLALNNTNKGSVFIFNAGIIFNEDTIRIEDNSESFIIKDIHSQMPKDDIGITEVNGFVSILSYGLPIKWCHMIYLRGAELEAMKRICCRNNSHMLLFEGINLLLASKKLSCKANIKQDLIKIYNSKTLKHENIN